MKIIKYILLPAILLVLFFPSRSLALSYNPNYLISDTDYTNSSSMNTDQIQRFLQSKGSVLANMRVRVEGVLKSVAQIFYSVGKQHQISQMLLLATAQKEQSALTRSSLSQTALNQLMGYGIYDSDFAGVYNQIWYAGRQFRRYLDNPANYNFRFGQTRTTQDGVRVNPQNSATAGLYNYTPVAGATTGTDITATGNGGNFLFWKIWNSYFAANYPGGTLVKEIGGGINYYIDHGKRRAVPNFSVFDHYKWSQNQVIEISRSNLEKYPEMKQVLYRDGTLIQLEGRGPVYVVEHGQKRGFVSRRAFDRLGYKISRIMKVSGSEFHSYDNGANITESENTHVDGTLIKQAGSAGVYLLENGKKRPIVDRLIFDSQFHWEEVITVSAAEFRRYREGQKVGFQGGTLFADEAGNVFVMENNLRRHIERPSVFHAMHYQVSNIKRLPNWIVLLHDGGAPITDAGINF